MFWFLIDVIQDPVPHQEAKEFSVAHDILGWFRSKSSVIPPGSDTNVTVYYCAVNHYMYTKFCPF